MFATCVKGQLQTVSRPDPPDIFQSSYEKTALHLFLYFFGLLLQRYHGKYTTYSEFTSSFLFISHPVPELSAEQKCQDAYLISSPLE